MKQLIYDFYDLEIDVIIKLSNDVYKLKSKQGEYVLKYLENTENIDALYSRLFLLNISSFAIPLVNKNGDYLTSYNNRYFQISLFYNDETISAGNEIIYVEDGEGCLSVNREFEGIVPRYARCTIEGYDKEIIVTQQTKGVYYTEIKFEKGEVDADTILVDVWDNIIIDGEMQEPQEYEFVTLKSKEKFGYKKRNSETYVPFANGINADERLEIGEVRDIEITFRRKYTTNEYKVFNDAEYRIYCMDGSKELVVFDYHPIDAYPFKNSITIDTMNFIPNLYFMDIKRGNEYYRDVLRFEVVSNINNKFI